MNSPLPAEPRSEPLLWLQLLGLAALPLEALLLLLLLAGSEPGPWPWLERLLAWALGVLAPALLLWRRPADPFSLLLISTPLRGRRELQRRLSTQQQALALRLAMALGAAALLPLLAWLDRWSVLARELAPLPEAPRLVALLLSAAVLALILWQWQQLLQAIWLLLRPAAALAAAPALSSEQIAASRLCLGLPLLLPDPLRFEAAARPRREPPRTPSPKQPAARPEPGAASEAPSSEPNPVADDRLAQATGSSGARNNAEDSPPPPEVPRDGETHDRQQALNPQEHPRLEDGLDQPSSSAPDNRIKLAQEHEEAEAVEALPAVALPAETPPAAPPAPAAEVNEPEARG